jgi:hypothetical protein
MVSKRMGLNLGGIGRKDLSEERIFKQRSEGWKTCVRAQRQGWVLHP